MTARRTSILAMGVLLSAALSAAPLLAAAQDAPQPQRVRGKVTSLTADTMVVKLKTGTPITVKLAPTWHVAALKTVTLAAIQPGSFIGTTTIERPDGTGRSLEVHVFPPGVKMGAGHYAWDLRPHSMMTNGDVGKVVTGPKGNTIEVSYPGGAHTVLVPPSAKIVEMGAGDRTMVKPGVSVFVIAQKQADGTLAADTVVVGEKGAPPPM
ncbi:MAG: hypothetical protein JWO83_1837 [Caulobacteraceae bacterium]|jgi:hypothetical protein|nr:hypothetical protein [Caulobacteraceae bacterium]